MHGLTPAAGKLIRGSVLVGCVSAPEQRLLLVRASTNDPVMTKCAAG
jgi:hypothetical protein